MTTAHAVAPGASRWALVGRWSPAAVIVAAGLAVGIVTQILQGELPDGWAVLANSGVVWAVCAFGLGAAMPSIRWAVGGGATTLVIASVVYYEAVEWFEGNGSDSTSAMIWSVAGIVAGSVFGLLGHWFTHHRDLRYAALAVVIGTLVGEGTHLVWFVENPTLRSAGIAELVIASSLAVVCFVGAARSLTWRGMMLIVAVGTAAMMLTLAAVEVIDAAFLRA